MRDQVHQAEADFDPLPFDAPAARAFGGIRSSWSDRLVDPRPDAAEYLLLAEALTGIVASALIAVARIEMADSAKHAGRPAGEVDERWIANWLKQRVRFT